VAPRLDREGDRDAEAMPRIPPEVESTTVSMRNWW